MTVDTRFYLPEDFVREVVDGVDLKSVAWSHVAMCCICDHTYHEHGGMFAGLACHCCGSTTTVPVRIERRRNTIERFLYGPLDMSSKCRVSGWTE